MNHYVLLGGEFLLTVLSFKRMGASLGLGAQVRSAVSSNTGALSREILGVPGHLRDLGGVSRMEELWENGYKTSERHRSDSSLPVTFSVLWCCWCSELDRSLWWGRPGLCEIFSSISGLYLLDASSTSSPQGGSTKVSVRRQNHPWVRTTARDINRAVG